MKMTKWTRLLTLKLCSVFLNRIYEVSPMCPNCVGSARHWCKNEQSFPSWWQKKCHIWLMPYATNFDGCCLINPAVMRQSCPSIRQKNEQKSSEERKKICLPIFQIYLEEKKHTWYWWAYDGTRRNCVWEESLAWKSHFDFVWPSVLFKLAKKVLILINTCPSNVKFITKISIPLT